MSSPTTPSFVEPSARRLAVSIAVLLVTVAVGGCATSAAFRAGEQAEQQRDYDGAVVEYTKAVRERPDDRDAQYALDRSKMRASQAHYETGRRLNAQGHYEEAVGAFQLAYELNPTFADAERELRETRRKVQTRLEAPENGQTELEALIQRTRLAASPGLDLPRGIDLPDSVIFREASARDVFSALGQFGGVTIVFDQDFRDSTVSTDLRGTTFDVAIATVATSTRNFFRVTGQNSVTIIPDTPAKRREYEEEIVRTFYLSNANVTETIDLLRLVIDLRRLAPVTATNAISIKDTPERIDAAAKLIEAIDKARAEVVIEIQLLEVDRVLLREYGIQFATPGSAGIDTVLSVDEGLLGLTIDDLRDLSGSDVFVGRLPSLFLRLLESNANTRILANPHLRTSDGISATANFGERVPVPVTTFTPIAAGGVSQQPITSFNYENIGVNIAITPRIHHNDEVSLVLGVQVQSISGTGFGDLPKFGNRDIQTTIRLRDGETNILAGLIRDDERETLEGMPGLNRVPVLGRLFGKNKIETQETDIVLTLTPHIIRVLDLDEEDLLPFRVGRDTQTTLATGVSATPVPPSQLTPQPRAQPFPPPTPGGVQQPVAPPPDPRQ